MHSYGYHVVAVLLIRLFFHPLLFQGYVDFQPTICKLVAEDAVFLLDS